MAFYKMRWRGGEKRADTVLMTSLCGIQYEEMERRREESWHCILEMVLVTSSCDNEFREKEEREMTLSLLK